MAQQNYDVMIEAENVEKINDMEWDIIKDVGHGMSNKEIAEHIGLTEGTVRNYISTILKKIGLRDRTQLAIWEVQSVHRSVEDKINEKNDKSMGNALSGRIIN